MKKKNQLNTHDFSYITKYFPKLLPKTISQNSSSKFLTKILAPKLRFFIPISQNNFPKLFCKPVSESFFHNFS